jgi:putative FmdB family regulatory protein
MHTSARYNQRRNQGVRRMPVYTYRCDSCGVQFEKHQSFSDAPLKTCPECRKKSLKKVITPTKIIFKGSGFYATDNRSSSGNSSRASKTENKTESKPAENSPETKSSDKTE